MIPPAELGGWHDLDDQSRLALVSSMQREARLKPEISAFLTEAVGDPRLGTVTRNNLANLLNRQETHDPRLAARYISMAEDRHEDPMWRDWAIQHAASAVAWAAEPTAIIARIRTIAMTDDGALAGTSLLHLDRLEQDGLVQLDDTYVRRVQQLAQSPTADISARITTVGLIGRRRQVESAPMLRELTQGGLPPALRRAVLAALGQVGDAGDLPLVRTHADDPDRLIAAAAQGAERRLLAAIPQANEPLPAP